MSSTSRADKRIARHIKNLESEDEKASALAEYYLIRYYGARALSQLIAACGHPMSQVRFRAVWALAATGDSRAYETVLRLTSDEDERVRYDATVALGKLGDERAIDALYQILLQNDETRPASLRDFGLRALEPLRQLLAMPDDGLRLAAVHDLGWITRETGSHECLDLVKNFVTDPNECVRSDAQDWLNQVAADAAKGK